MIEVIWQILVTFGSAISVWAIWDCWQDLRTVRTLDAPIRVRVAMMALRNETVRFAIHLSGFGLGLYALLYPHREADDPQAGFLLILVLFSAQVLLLASSLLDRRDRVKISEDVAHRLHRAHREATLQAFASRPPTENKHDDDDAPPDHHPPDGVPAP